MSNIIDFKGSVADLEKLVADYNGLSFLDINASWCPACRRLAGLIPRLAGDNEDVHFIKIDVDENPEVKAHFGVESIPVIKFCKAEKKLEALDTLLGVNIPTIKEKIASYK